MSYDWYAAPRRGDSEPDHLGNITSNCRQAFKLLLGEEVWEALTGHGCAAWFFVYAARDAIGWWSNLSEIRQDAIRYAIDPDNEWGDMVHAVSFLNATAEYLSTKERADGQIVTVQS